ncbi:chromosome segregation protein SMC [Senimuribacter intestinalis]|uniref:chromosome segregation protein SMC n=1 Tax=Senimuribacter intestinalis TaxID=2941507 RepID=UPI00203A8D39|nr:chromosome segregation protein SMC [Senimuribacter intestinalis]
MYFKRLEMHGFKSFAEPVVIEFHEGVTCIVGPNGSGKSNISDAIRWVLGEQSPKALRGGKMEEVIFAGTASRKSRGMAEVTLVIDNSTGILNIDYNEVAITRRMYRSGESEYLINNNQCRLRDIRELIMDTGIGVDGYSLIGQGKIADIVSNKPESRREIFEEAAGVVMYKSKKAEAERKLESTGNNLDRVNDIVSEIEGRIDGLKEDSVKAKEYLELKERYRDLEINITLKNIDNILSRNDIYQKDIAGLSEELAEITEKKQNIDKEAEADREKNEHLEQLGNEARDKLLHIVEEMNRRSSESQLSKERLSGIEKDSTRLTGEIEELSGRLSREEENKAQLEKSKEEIARNHEEAAALLQEQVTAHSALTREASELTDTIDNSREEMFRLHNLNASKKSEVKSYESIRETLQKRKEQLNEEANGAAESQEESNEMLAKAEAESRQNEQLLAEIKAKISSMTEERKQLELRRKMSGAKVEELKLSGSQKVARKKTIEEMENNYEGYNYAVKYIMRSGLSGISGVVAELMEVPTGLEVAIETALGGQMQNIICDDDASAKRAIAKLKENKAGRLTFLPAASIKGGRAKIDQRIAADPGYKGLAADCITCRDEYRNIFEYLLGRVVIAADMDAAIRLSKISGTGLRFVTLDGEIINVSGAITGGKFKNKTANLLERRSEITTLEKEIEVLRAELSEAAEENRKAAEKAEVLDGELAELRQRRRDTELKQVSFAGRITALKDALNQITDSSVRFAQELSSIEKDSKDAAATVETLLEEMRQAETQIETLNHMIEEAMAAYETKKAVIDEASEGITKTRIAATEWESKKNNIESLLTRISETAEDYRFQIETKERQLSALGEEKNRLLFGTDGAEEDIARLAEEKQNTENYIEEVGSQRSLLTEKLSSVTKEQQGYNERLNSCQDQKYQLEIKVAKNETQLDTLKERLWEDFEISYAQAVDLRNPDFVMSTSVKESRDIRNRIRELGEVNVGAIKEYETVSQRYEFLTSQRADIITAMDELRGIIAEMDTTIKTKFKENFDQVVERFEVIFRELFGGGHAELRMEDENNPLESGIDIIAQPPGKKLQNINLMSGGEKTMTAIALMFAVLKTKPTPFCILDEVEAALDDANIDRFAKYLRRFDNIQFALVTHQKATMEHADVLYGVTMPEQGISKVLSLRLGDDFAL